MTQQVINVTAKGPSVTRRIEDMRNEVFMSCDPARAGDINHVLEELRAGHYNPQQALSMAEALARDMKPSASA